MTSPSLAACPCGTTGPCANPNCHVRTGRLPGGTCIVDTCDECARHNVGPCPHASPARSSDRLILEIEVPDFNVDGAQEAADEFLDGDVLAIVTEEWMREEVGVTFVTLPGEKCMNDDFEIVSRICRIVGARIAGEASNQEHSPAKERP